jgi:hypothetical protein
MTAARKPARAAEPKAAPRRARETRVPLADYADEILVVCPRCSGPAILRRRDPAERDTAAPRRLVCRRCGHMQETSGGSRARPAALARNPLLRRGALGL